MGMIGERVVRTEDPALVTGRATYVDNLVIDGAVHVVYVRSTIAHARVVSIDTSDARSMPGVVGVFTHADLAADGIGPLPIDMPLLPADIRRTALADGTVRFVGELVAAVVP